MSRREDSFVVRVHEDPDLFREAVNFTTAETAFAPRLIEKDYFCTVLLAHLAGAADDRLVFKGGTCLAKVYADFYRLSEDLDFVIAAPITSTRSERSKLAAGMKRVVALLPERLPGFRLVHPLKGANNSTQYIAVVGYPSLMRQQEETIKIEVGLREPLLTPVLSGRARTIMLDPVSGKPLIPPVSVNCISRTEALAEKFRAALSRREVAIRDFFDIDYAVRKLALDPEKPAFVRLIRHKLDIPGNEPVDVSGERLKVLRYQVESRLKPVLRAKDFAEFDLDRAFKAVTTVAAMVR
jgi:predicted nucleotidyltransferase component of viral defense system